MRNPALKRYQRLIVNKLEKVQQLSVAGIENPSRTTGNYFINFTDENSFQKNRLFGSDKDVDVGQYIIEQPQHIGV
jgi:hypothetical protein